MSKKDFLPDKVVEIVSKQKKGKLLDLGSGNGTTGKKLFDLGFDVEAFDMDRERFKYHKEIQFSNGNLNDPLPYENNTFDFIIFMEVIEHIYNPGFVISEISRILKKDGKLILSTPNILNIGSRFRFLIEGSFDFFREPTLDYSKTFPLAIQNMHVIPWRYQELEYLLHNYGLETAHFHVDKRKNNFIVLAALMKPVLFLQSKVKDVRIQKKGGVDCARMNIILNSWDLLLGRHLILEAVKSGDVN